MYVWIYLFTHLFTYLFNVTENEVNEFGHRSGWDNSKFFQLKAKIYAPYFKTF